MVEKYKEVVTAPLVETVTVILPHIEVLSWQMESWLPPITLPVKLNDDPLTATVKTDGLLLLVTE